MTRLFITCLAALLGGSSAAAPPRFVLTDLGTLPGGQNSEALDINDAGVIVGSSNSLGTGYHNAVMWLNGRIIDLTGNGDSGAFAYAVNNLGQVVGASDEIAGGEIASGAFLWWNGAITSLPFHSAVGLNDRQQIVGVDINKDNFGLAALWQSSQLTPLATLGGTSNSGHDINDAGTIVGVADTPGSAQPQPVMWDQGVIHALPTLGGDFGIAESINARGVIVGYTTTTTTQFNPPPHAAVWQDGNVSDLGTLHPSINSYSRALGVNDAGWIVGHSLITEPWQQHAVLWADGRMLDLNAITVRPPNVVLVTANAVNNNKSIVGSALFGILQAPRAALLTPIPPVDVSGDGSVNVADLLGVINAWGPCPNQPMFCAPDVSPLEGGDRVVNVGDLLAVISGWGDH